MTDCCNCPVSLGCHAGTLNTRMGQGTVLCPICLDLVVVVPADPIVPGMTYLGKPVRQSQVTQLNLVWHGRTFMDGTRELSSGPSIREDRDEDLTMRLQCCERPIEKKMRQRWFNAFYGQGTTACLKIKDPGPPQRHEYIYMKMCMDCWRAYQKRIHKKYKFVAPRECKNPHEQAKLVQEMLECCEDLE